MLNRLRLTWSLKKWASFPNFFQTWVLTWPVTHFSWLHNLPSTPKPHGRSLRRVSLLKPLRLVMKDSFNNWKISWLSGQCQNYKAKFTKKSKMTHAKLPPFDLEPAKMGFYTELFSDLMVNLTIDPFSRLHNLPPTSKPHGRSFRRVSLLKPLRLVIKDSFESLKISW